MPHAELWSALKVCVKENWGNFLLALSINELTWFRNNILTPFNLEMFFCSVHIRKIEKSFSLLCSVFKISCIYLKDVGIAKKINERFFTIAEAISFSAFY